MNLGSLRWTSNSTIMVVVISNALTPRCASDLFIELAVVVRTSSNRCCGAHWQLFGDWLESRRRGLARADVIDAANADAAIIVVVVVVVVDLDGRRVVAVWDVEPGLHVRKLTFEFIVVCKIDAVYRRGDRVEIVDWKTGKAPRDAADLELKQLQLALYRLAYARREGLEPESIDAVFFYVAEDRVIRPDRIHSEAELRRLWRRVVAPAG